MCNRINSTLRPNLILISYLMSQDLNEAWAHIDELSTQSISATRYHMFGSIISNSTLGDNSNRDFHDLITIGEGTVFLHLFRPVLGIFDFVILPHLLIFRMGSYMFLPN